MKTDLYTKVVLTVIAACLLVLVGQQTSLVPAAQAAPASPAAGRTYGLVPVNADGSVTVRLQTAEAMPVNIVGIHKPFSSNDTDRYSWDAIKVSLK